MLGSMNRTHLIPNALIRKYGKRGDAVIRNDWRGWKRVLQVQRKLRWRPVRMTDKTFLRRVYREDSMAEQDWSTIICKQETPGRPHLEPLNDSLQWLHNEYMLAIFDSGSRYSVDVPADVIGADGDLQRGVETRHFHLLQIAHGNHRPKVMPCVDASANLQMVCPLAFEVIFETRREPDAAAPDADSVHVFSESDPVWLRPADIASFTVVIQSLRRFDTILASSVDGCLALRDSVRVRHQQALTDKDCPTLAIIWHLKRTGWRCVDRKVEHRDLVERVFDGSGAHRSKLYLQCVVNRR